MEYEVDEKEEIFNWILRIILFGILLTAGVFILMRLTSI